MVDPKIRLFPYDESKSRPYNEFKNWVPSSLNPPEMSHEEKADASAFREGNHSPMPSLFKAPCLRATWNLFDLRLGK
jgi:hypothetical protein